MRFRWLRLSSNLILAAFSLVTTVVIYQNCEPIHYSTSIASSGNGILGTGCNPATYGTQPFTNGNVTGVCSCNSNGQEVCTPTGCTDPNATLSGNQCTSPTASSLALTINGQTSLSLLPSTTPVAVVVSSTGPVHALNNAQSRITRVAGSCVATGLTPTDIQLPGGVLTLGTQNFIYSSTLAPLIKGCTWRVTAVADTGASAYAEFTALLCSAGTVKPTSPACTTADGKSGTLTCTNDGLDYECKPTTPVNCTFNGTVIPNGGHVTAYTSATVPYGQLCSGETRVCTNGVLSGSKAYSSCTETPGASCIFNGQQIADGAQVLAYSSSSVAYGQTCQSGALVCHNGNLIGNYTYPTCTVQGNPNCTVNGTTLNNGQTRVVYQSTSVPYGSTCNSQTLLCTNGVVTGMGTSNIFAYSSCQVQPPQSCNFNGQTIAHGGGVTGWRDSVVPFGSTCTSQYRQCNNGVLTGTYSFVNCAVTPPRSCPYNGQTVAHGSTVQGFATTTVAYGATCSPITATCNDGTLSRTIVPTCSTTPGGPCIYNGQSVPSDTVIQGFVAASVPFGSTCTTKQITCTNGTLSGTVYPTCQVQGDPNCYVNGQRVNNGQSQTFYAATQVAYGQTCASQSQTRTCNNGVLSGETKYQYLTCTVTPPANCPFNGATIQNGQSVTAYSSSQVEPGQTCSSVSITRTCSNGTLSGSTSYSYSTCTVRPPRDCVFQGTTYHDGQTVTAYTQSSVSYGNTCTSEVRTCRDGTLTGSAQFPSCTVNPPATCTFAGETIAHGAAVTAYSSTSSETCPHETATCQNGVLPLSTGYIYKSCTVVLPVPRTCVYSACRSTSDHNKIACGYAYENFHPEAVCSGKLIYGTYEGPGGTGPTTGPGPYYTTDSPNWATLPALLNIPGARCVVFQKLGYSTGQYQQFYNSLYYDGVPQAGASSVPNVSCTSGPAPTPVPTAAPTAAPTATPTLTPPPGNGGGGGGGGGCLRKNGTVGLMVNSVCN